MLAGVIEEILLRLLDCLHVNYMPLPSLRLQIFKKQFFDKRVEKMYVKMGYTGKLCKSK